MKMRSKILAVFFSFFLAGVLYAGGIGVSGSFHAASPLAFGGRLDYAPDTIPFVFAADINFCDGGTKSALAGVEFTAGNIHLYKALNFFYAPELCAGYDFLENKVILENAFYLGLNGFFAPHFQLFTQAGWALQVLFADYAVSLNLVNFPIRAGLRFWTK